MLGLVGSAMMEKWMVPCAPASVLTRSSSSAPGWMPTMVPFSLVLGVSSWAKVAALSPERKRPARRPALTMPTYTLPAVPTEILMLLVPVLAVSKMSEFMAALLTRAQFAPPLDDL